MWKKYNGNVALNTCLNGLMWHRKEGEKGMFKSMRKAFVNRMLSLKHFIVQYWTDIVAAAAAVTILLRILIDW